MTKYVAFAPCMERLLYKEFLYVLDTLRRGSLYISAFLSFASCIKKETAEENRAHVRTVASIAFMKDVDLSSYFHDRKNREKYL